MRELVQQQQIMLSGAQTASISQIAYYPERFQELPITKVLPTTKKVVIVSQQPPAGGDVPRGTVVNLTLALKDDLPMASLGVIKEVATKWQNPALVEADVATVPALGPILVEKPRYKDLSDGERAIFDAFAAANLDLSKVDKSQAYGDIQFAYTL
jgi:hypothetical protein